MAKIRIQTIIFCLIGILLIATSFYYSLGVFNPYFIFGTIWLLLALINEEIENCKDRIKKIETIIN